MASPVREMRCTDHDGDIESSTSIGLVKVVFEDDIAPNVKSDCIISIYCIASLFMVYVFIIFALISMGPRLVYKRSNDDLTDLANGMGFVFVFGISSLLIATIATIATLCRWNQIPQRTKALGLFPMICSLSIIIAAIATFSIANGGVDEVPPYCHPLGEDSGCPTPQNHVNSNNNNV